MQMMGWLSSLNNADFVRFDKVTKCVKQETKIASVCLVPVHDHYYSLDVGGL
jgi:hypothetical protein